MFSLVRFFHVTGAIAITAVIVAVVLYRQNEVNRLIALAESQNIALAQSFANTIWPYFASHVASASSIDREALRTHPETQHIRKAVETVSAGLATLKVKIYNLDGLTVYSSNPAEIGEDKSNNPGFFGAASAGRPASRLTFRDTLSSFEKTVQDRDVVESYLPIRMVDGPVEGVFELYTDVTALLAGIRRSTINLAVGFVLIFGLLYGTLFLTVRRADRTIKRQYDNITEKNAALQREVAERQRAEAALNKAHDELEQRVVERTRELTEEIAERKRAEDEARRHRNALARVGAVVVMGEMATTLAHELNQPLAVISGAAQVCLRDLRATRGPRAELLDYVEQVAEQAERANEIVRRVRGFIRQADQERRQIDVNETIRGVADLLRLDAQEHGGIIEFELAAALPGVVADPIQIQQVILNLAHNGMEAMNETRPASRTLTIQTRTRQDGEVEVAVRDVGPRIPTDTLERMFEPFFTTKSDGLGMGLAISRSIVEAHGGRLSASSDGEAGTTLRFTLPIAQESRPR
jgi:phosphoglycerate-specific signal transduction histidine kinase